MLSKVIELWSEPWNDPKSFVGHNTAQENVEEVTPWHGSGPPDGLRDKLSPPPGRDVRSTGIGSVRDGYNPV